MNYLLLAKLGCKCFCKMHQTINEVAVIQNDLAALFCGMTFYAMVAIEIQQNRKAELNKTI